MVILGGENMAESKSRRAVKMKTKLVERICDLMEQKGLNQSQLAHLCGLSQSTISKILSGERGRDLRHSTIYAIADTLGASAGYLTGKCVGEDLQQERDRNGSSAIGLLSKEKRRSTRYEAKLGSEALFRYRSSGKVITARSSRIWDISEGGCCFRPKNPVELRPRQVGNLQLKLQSQLVEIDAKIERILEDRIAVSFTQASNTKKYFDKEKWSKRSEKPKIVTSLDELRVLYERTIPTKHPCLGASIDDLDWEIVKEFAEAVEPGLIWEKSREEVLEDLKLFSIIRHNEKRFLHKSAVLCFCRRPSVFYPQARAVFLSGKSTCATFLTKDITGPLSEQISQLVVEVTAHLDKASFISDDGLRRESDEIDREVIRELISNAIIHRNYEMNGTVKVRITKEALEVENPGSFPDATSWDVLIKSEHTSNPIDPTISLYMSYVESKPFEGIGRGFEIFKKYIKQNGPDSIICKELAGPTVRIRVRRPGVFVSR